MKETIELSSFMDRKDAFSWECQNAEHHPHGEINVGPIKNLDLRPSRSVPNVTSLFCPTIFVLTVVLIRGKRLSALKRRSEREGYRR